MCYLVSEHIVARREGRRMRVGDANSSPGMDVSSRRIVASCSRVVAAYACVLFAQLGLRVYQDDCHTLAYTALVRPVGRRAGPPALGQVTPAAGGWAPGCSSLFQIVTSTSAPAAARAATVHSDITCLCVKRARPEVPRLEVLLQAPAGQSLSWQLFCDISKSTT